MCYLAIKNMALGYLIKKIAKLMSVKCLYSQVLTWVYPRKWRRLAKALFKPFWGLRFWFWDPRGRFWPDIGFFEVDFGVWEGRRTWLGGLGGRFWGLGGSEDLIWGSWGPILAWFWVFWGLGGRFRGLEGSNNLILGVLGPILTCFLEFFFGGGGSWGPLGGLGGSTKIPRVSQATLMTKQNT